MRIRAAWRKNHNQLAVGVAIDPANYMYPASIRFWLIAWYFDVFFGESR